MTLKPYDVEVATRIEKLRHERRYVYFTEPYKGRDGIERIYGYEISGVVYLLNVDYVIAQLKLKEAKKNDRK